MMQSGGMMSTVGIQKEVQGNLKPASDPLEFIKNNLKTLPIQAAPEQATGQIVPNPTPPPIQSFQSEPPREEEPEATTQEAMPESAAEQPKSATELLEKTKDTSEENLKNQRKKINEYKRQLEEERATLLSTTNELEKYKKGEVLPEVIKQKEDRITELEKYEKLHALKLSNEYQKKFVEPAIELHKQAAQMAADYGVETEVFKEALQIENKRDLNRYLKNYFDDDVASLEARELIVKIKDINRQAQEAEQEPAQVFERLKEEHRKETLTKEQNRIESIIRNSEDGWVEGLTEVRKEEKYPELMIRGDEQHDNLVRPIIDGAAQEYGKFIKLLGELGVKELPRDVAKVLAKRFQLSQAAGVMAVSREHHYKQSEDLLNQTNRQASMIRPPVGSMGGGTSGGGASKPSSPTDAAKALLNKVGVKV